METTLTIVINAVVAILGSSVGYFFGYRKNQKEAESIGIQNVEKALDIYKQMLDDMKKRYDLEIENLKNQLIQSQQHIIVLESKIKELKKTK